MSLGTAVNAMLAFPLGPRLVWCPVCRKFDRGAHIHVKKKVDEVLDKKPAGMDFERARVDGKLLSGWN